MKNFDKQSLNFSRSSEILSCTKFGDNYYRESHHKPIVSEVNPIRFLAADSVFNKFVWSRIKLVFLMYVLLTPSSDLVCFFHKPLFVESTNFFSVSSNYF